MTSSNKAKGITLTKKQEEFILANYEKMDLAKITQEVFNNSALRGNTQEGRAVRKFLLDKKLKYKTTKPKKKEDIFLTENQKDFIKHNVSVMSSVEMAKILFPEALKVKNLTGVSKEAIAVQTFIKEEFGENYLPDEDEMLSDNYVPPANVNRVLTKIRNYMGIDMKEKELDGTTRKNLEKLVNYLNDFRLKKTVSAYKMKSQRELFESNFIANTWDKPDLTQGDIQSYINLAVNYVIMHEALKQKALLDKYLVEVLEDSDAKISLGLTDALDKVQKLYENTEKRVADLIKNLEGTRNERKKNQIEESKSILVLVEAFRNKEKRDEMIRIAEYEKMLVEKEGEKIERASDYIAKLFGVGKKEAVGG